MNTKLLVNPMFREFNPQKWMTKKDFLANKITYRDKSWSRALSFDPNYPEPFYQNQVKFRDPNGKNGGGEKNNTSFTTSPNHEKMFNSVIPRDPWRQRLSNSNSIRQQQHLLQTLNIKLKNQEPHQTNII